MSKKSTTPIEVTPDNGADNQNAVKPVVKQAINVTVRARLQGFPFALPLVSDDNGAFAREGFRKVGSRFDEFESDSIVIEYTGKDGTFTGKVNLVNDQWFYQDTTGEFTQERASWQTRTRKTGTAKVHDRGLELARVLHTISARIYPKPEKQERGPGVRSRINALTLAINAAVDAEDWKEVKRLNAELSALTTPANKDANPS